jgi:hypothetical protein
MPTSPSGAPAEHGEEAEGPDLVEVRMRAYDSRGGTPEFVLEVPRLYDKLFHVQELDGTLLPNGTKYTLRKLIAKWYPDLDEHLRTGGKLAIAFPTEEQE